MDKLSNIIIRRNGESFFLDWTIALEKELRDLENKGFRVKDIVGHGGRGVVFLIENDLGQEMAAKVFVYSEEMIPQREALNIWRGIAPNIIKTFSERTLFLEYFKTNNNAPGLEDGLSLIKKIIQNSPNNRNGANIVNEYFSLRLLRARERNKIHGLYSDKEVRLVEKSLLNIPRDQVFVVHGDFSPGNVLSVNNDFLLIDPRSFLWGDISVDIGKWILTYKSGRDIEEGVDFFKKNNFLKPGVLPWLLIQAYDDSSAFASFDQDDPRISRYRKIVQNILS